MMQPKGQRLRIDQPAGKVTRGSRMRPRRYILVFETDGQGGGRFIYGCVKPRPVYREAMLKRKGR